MFQSVGVGLVDLSCEPELCGVPISMMGLELSEAVRGIWPRA